MESNNKQDLLDLKARMQPNQVYGKYVSLSKQNDTYVGRCPFHSEKTASFKVDNKKGDWVFHCFGCKKGGDAVHFIQLIERINVPQAIQRLRELVDGAPAAPRATEAYRDSAGLVDQTFQAVADVEEPKKTVELVKYQKSVADLLRNTEAVRFLNEERGITTETAERLNLGFVKEHPYALKNEANRSKGWVCFPRIYGDVVRAIKFRSTVDKDFSQVKGMDSRTFFNFESVNPFEPIFVTEGEFDTCIMEQAGFCAVSVPSAGAKLTPEMKDTLKLAPAIYLAGDNDGGVGNEYMRKLGRELGEKTYLITWQGAKDANEYFLKVCQRDVEKFRQGVLRHMETARATPIEGFTNVVELLMRSKDENAELDKDRLHFKTKSIDDMNYNPRGSVVIVYSTYTGTGKSILITREVAVHEAKRGEVVVVLSPEIRSQQYLSLLASQVVGSAREGGLPRSGLISEQDYKETASRIRHTYSKNVHHEHYHMRDENFDQLTQLYVGWSLPVTGADEVIAFIEEVIKRTGATRFVIDTLHKIVQPKGGESQTDAEGRTAKAIEGLGIKYGTIFLLVGQSNKEAEGIQASRHDEHGILRGSRELSDAAASIYLLHRKRALPTDNGEADDILELDAGLYLKKERFKGKGRPQVKLRLDKNVSVFYEAITS